MTNTAQWLSYVGILKQPICICLVRLPLFRPLTKKSGYSLRNGKLFYTHCREIFMNTLKELGYDPKKYGLHSLRSGGATAVMSNNVSQAVS